MKILNIKIIGQSLQWENSFPIVAGSQGYLYCNFIYPKNWDELNKEIRFYNSFDKKYYDIDIFQDLVEIPPEVLKGKNFFIAIGGYKDATFVPTSALEIPLLDNGFGEPDETIEEGSPSYDTVTAVLLDLATKNPYIGENNNWFIWNNETKQYEDSGQVSQGKSAYQIALDNGFEGTEEEWLESLKSDAEVSITVDDKMSDTSTNPVQNKVVYEFVHEEAKTITNELKEKLVGLKTANNGEIFNVYDGENKNIASNNNAHAEGSKTEATHENTHAEGRKAKAHGKHSHAQNYDTLAKGESSTATGVQTKAYQKGSLAEGISSIAGDPNGNDEDACGAHAEGNGTQAIAQASHSEGVFTKSEGAGAHSEGNSTIAYDDFTHAEGDSTQSYKKASHAEGGSTIAGKPPKNIDVSIKYPTGTQGGTGSSGTGGSGTTEDEGVWGAHAEGLNTRALAKAAHAEGEMTKASRYAAHAEGIGTIADTDAQHVQGKYNDPLYEDGIVYLDMVGNGTSDKNRSNAYTLDENGNAWFAGKVSVGKTKETLATIKYVDNLVGDIEILLGGI